MSDGINKKKQSHFVLVHGACHGAWCWYKVATVLKAEGHRVTTLDMAAAGVNTKRLDELSKFSDYYIPLREFLADLPLDEKVVLVGHSNGGISISFAMEKFPEKIAVAVFVTAFMPVPGQTVQSFLDKVQPKPAGPMEPYMDNKISLVSSNGDDDDKNKFSSFIFGPNFMASKLYQLSPPEDLTLATVSLRPIRNFTGDEDYLNKDALTKQNYGSVLRVFVVCEEDNIMQKEFQEWMIENNPPDEVRVISGADHMAMCSKPNELCICLQDFAGKYS